MQASGIQCPECGDSESLTGTGGQTPTVTCHACGHVWTRQPSPYTGPTFNPDATTSFADALRSVFGYSVRRMHPPTIPNMAPTGYVPPTGAVFLPNVEANYWSGDYRPVGLNTSALKQGEPSPLSVLSLDDGESFRVWAGSHFDNRGNVIAHRVNGDRSESAEMTETLSWEHGSAEAWTDPDRGLLPYRYGSVARSTIRRYANGAAAIAGRTDGEVTGCTIPAAYDGARTVPARGTWTGSEVTERGTSTGRAIRPAPTGRVMATAWNVGGTCHVWRSDAMGVNTHAEESVMPTRERPRVKAGTPDSSKVLVYRAPVSIHFPVPALAMATIRGMGYLRAIRNADGRTDVKRSPASRVTAALVARDARVSPVLAGQVKRSAVKRSTSATAAQKATRKQNRQVALRASLVTL